MAKFRVRVFGKHGCPKCTVLNQRIDGLLEKPEWSDFEKEYFDVETEAGLVEFALAECLNPQRIPAFLVLRVADDGRVDFIPNPRPGASDPVCRDSRLYTHLGLQTDYSNVGKGVISGQMIAQVFEEARGLVPAAS